uniref:keratin, type I cytoskeletal 12-like n=1 Tax=Ciona intestinalis TaxID=7719 RepID=UPI000EF51634
MKGLEEEVLMLRSNIEITAKEKDENASELSELTNSIQIKVTKYENSLDVKEKQIQGLETSLKEVQMERNYLNQELAALKVNHQNELQKHDVTSALVEQLKLNCQQKETEVAKKSQNLEELETQVLELNEKLISHQSEGLRLVSANQKLQNQVANHSTVVESLQQGVCKLEKDKLDLVEEMANLKLTSDSVVLSLQEEAENTQSKAREQEVLLKTRMEEVEALKEKNRSLGSELEDVGKLFEDSKLQVESHERHAKELERLVENMKQVMTEKQDEN